MGLSIAIIIGVAVIVILCFVLSGYAVGKSATNSPGETTEDLGGETLRYRIPDTQDPAVLITHL